MVEDETRSPDPVEGPWHPVRDCIKPLIGVLAPDRFAPTAWDILPPDLHHEYRRLDVQMCYLWLQTYLNPQTATDFRSNLDSCMYSWADWKKRARDRGWPLMGDSYQWREWADENPDLKEQWDEAIDGLEATQEYLRKLAAIIESKIEAKRRADAKGQADKMGEGGGQKRAAAEDKHGEGGRGPKRKHSDDTCRKAQKSYDEFYDECKDYKGAWGKVAQHHGFTTWQAAKQACYRWRQKQNKKCN